MKKDIVSIASIILCCALSGCNQEDTVDEIDVVNVGDGDVNTSVGEGASSNGGTASGGNDDAETTAATGGVTDVDTLNDPSMDLNDRLKVVDVPLAETVTNDSFARGFILPGARPAGGLILGWNHNEQGRLSRLNANMVQEGEDWVLEGQLIVDVVGLPDDGVVVMVTDYGTGKSLTNSFDVDRQLRLLRLDAEGNQVAEIPIVGGNGRTEDSDWYAWFPVRSADVVPNGDRFSVFTAISHNFDTPENIHQGDLYIEVDSNGELDEDTEYWWGSSHSNRLHALLGPDGEGLTLTVGDGGPYGLVYHNRNERMRQVVWPPEDQRQIGDDEGISTIDAGDLCGFTRQGERLFATVSTVPEQPFNYRDDNGDIALLSWHMDGGDVDVSWLTNTPNIPERCPTLSSLKDHQLSVWGVKDGNTATLALLDNEGNLVNGPTESSAPFYEYSMAVPLTDGSVAWTYVNYGESDAKVVIVSPQYSLQNKKSQHKCWQKVQSRVSSLIFGMRVHLFFVMYMCFFANRFFWIKDRFITHT